jgi:hypothetical protein
MAQYSSVTEMPVQDTFSTQGFRIALVRPMLALEIKAADLNQPLMTENLDSSLGLSAGYVSLPVQAVGFTASGTFLDIKDRNDSLTIVRADGNLAYAFSHQVNVKGGFNLSNISIKDANQSFSPGIGVQASVGFQITKNFGLDLGYTIMNQSTTVEGIRVNLKESGPELAVNGTF